MGNGMRERIDLNEGWQFTGPSGSVETVDVPHTWNAVDGQDGGNDYWRGACTYERTFATPDFDPELQCVYLEFEGVNATADVSLNGCDVIHHDGGYSTFRADITAQLAESVGAENALVVRADNSVNDHVYPQKADFTFYGGIYRPVRLVVVNKAHFAMDYFGGPGFWVTPKLNGGVASVEVTAWAEGADANVSAVAIVREADGTEVARAVCEPAGSQNETAATIFNCTLAIAKPHLWDGVDDPYLYTIELELIGANKSAGGPDGPETLDTVTGRFGIRSFRIDPKEGFFLNGRSYPLRGMSRHQDRKGLGNALTCEQHREDMELIKEIGANTVRLAHYQHSQTFYDLCDEAGMVVWAEIPYISEHLPNARENTVSQMKELIVQNYNHPSICVWGLSNEITISTKDKADMLDNHRMLNDLVHKMDPTRPTTLACYAMCGPFNKSAHISDVVAWNLYLGWYVPGLWLNKAWFGFWRKVYPNRAIGMSEYGCEAMPNLHSSKPRREDHTEEYQCIYHEYMIKFFEKRPYFWATHVWNMFDFAADARDQGGEPGMNHKGLVTFDRQTKKDAFYAYKAAWSKDPFVHVCGKRYVDRAEKTTVVKVYSNQPEVELIVNGARIARKRGSKFFSFYVPLTPGDNLIEARAGDLIDTATIRGVDEPNPAYALVKEKNKQKNNWV